MTHICVCKLSIIGSDYDLSPEQPQAIIWTNAGILLVGPLGKNFSEIQIEIQTFPLKKIRLKMSLAKCCSFRLGLNVLNILIGCVSWNNEVFHHHIPIFYLLLNKVSCKITKFTQTFDIVWKHLAKQNSIEYIWIPSGIILYMGSANEGWH